MRRWLWQPGSVLLLACGAASEGGAAGGGGVDPGATTGGPGPASTASAGGAGGDGAGGDGAGAAGSTGPGGAGGAPAGTGGQGVGAGGSGGDGAGGLPPPTGETCMAADSREACEALGCSPGWTGVFIHRQEAGACIYDKIPVGRCLHATTLENPGGVTSAWWWDAPDGVEVFEAGSFCDYELLQPCLGRGDEIYPGEPENCRCAYGGQWCPPFPDE